MKSSDSARELAKKKASKNGKQNSQVTSNIPSVPTSFASAGMGMSMGGPNPAGGYKTANLNPYKSSPTGGSISAYRNYKK